MPADQFPMSLLCLVRDIVKCKGKHTLCGLSQRQLLKSGTCMSVWLNATEERVCSIIQVVSSC